MPDDKPNGGGQPSGGDNNPAPPAKTADQRLAEMEEGQKKMQAQFQATQEELKRVNNLNGVLMQRLNAGGSGNPSNSDGGSGMDVSRTVPIKLRRDFSQMDPTVDPGRFATELVAETAEQVAAAMARNSEVQAQNANLRKSFYEKHKDLVGYEIEVGHFSNEVQAQNPSISVADAFEEVAKRTREYVKSRGLTSPADPNNPPNPPHALPPSSGGAGGAVPIKPPDGGKDEPYNADKVYQEDMAFELKMRNQERTKDGQRAGKA